jgi:hypothetical protein
MALVAVIAVLLGSWRVLGGWALLAALGAVVLALPAVWRPRWLYAWLLPVVWTAVAWSNFAYPGDEYGGFGLGSLAGLWIIAIIDSITDPNRMLPLILIAGAVTVAAAGALMDKLRVPWIPFLVLWMGAAAALFLWWFVSFPSVERALAKNGSYQAYVLPSINIGLYIATITMLLATSIYRVAHWVRNRFAVPDGARHVATERV